MNMEIDGFYEISSTVLLAKALYDIDRYDIVKSEFFDTLDCDSWLENMQGTVSSIFSGYNNIYSEYDDVEMYIFTDDCFSAYYTIAWEYGKNHNVRHDDNPYVIAANKQVHRWIGGCYSMGYKLLSRTKTRRAARQSKLILYVGTCDCNCHTHLAYNLVQIYKWFTDKVADFNRREEMLAA